MRSRYAQFVLSMLCSSDILARTVRTYYEYIRRLYRRAFQALEPEVVDACGTTQPTEYAFDVKKLVTTTFGGNFVHSQQLQWIDFETTWCTAVPSFKLPKRFAAPLPQQEQHVHV